MAMKSLALQLILILTFSCYLSYSLSNKNHHHHHHQPPAHLQIAKRQTAKTTNDTLKQLQENNKTDSAQEANKINSKISYKTRWFTQLTDHFTWANQDTYQQRYLVNDDHWCGKNCPILFYCGNEGDIEVFTNNTGWMWENAANLHAMLVFAEHRFYGKSMPYNIDPTKVTPNATKSLGYLSSEQALADYARLIYELKNNLYDAKYSPVIAIGGSYGGMLAAWMRMKYPNAVAGALAGSAPILQFPDEYDCGSFNKIVTKDYENYSINCSLSIAKSWQTIRDFAASSLPNNNNNRLDNTYGDDGGQGLVKLGSIFKVCQPLQEDDVDLLLQMLSSIWVNMAMTDYANEADFLSKMPAYPIKHACESLNSDPINLSDVELIERIAKASQVYTNYTGNQPCLDFKGIVFDPMEVMWDFQSCTEMVMPICSDGINDMFDPQPFNLSSFVADCKQRWGVKTQVNKIRTLYGDKNMGSVSNIIFSSCSRDPWSAGCPQESVEANSIHAIKIPGVCHHEDLRASGPNDSAEIKKARQEELNIISDWVQKHYDNMKKYLANETLIWHRVSRD